MCKSLTKTLALLETFVQAGNILTSVIIFSHVHIFNDNIVTAAYDDADMGH